MTSGPALPIGAMSRLRWPARVAAAMAATLLALPGSAHPGGLAHLLQLPLEELLRQEIAVGEPATPPRSGVRAVRPASAERSGP